MLGVNKNAYLQWQECYPNLDISVIYLAYHTPNRLQWELQNRPCDACVPTLCLTRLENMLNRLAVLSTASRLLC